MKFHRTPARIVQAAFLGALLQTQADAIFIQLDYTFDTGNFFAPGSEERARLEDAAGFYENLLLDDLSAITPTGPSYPIPDSWVIDFKNPSTGVTQTVDNPSIPADTLVVYAGARSFGTGQIAEAGFGGALTSAFTNSAFDIATQTRGETGVGTTDFAPWGGAVAVDTGTTWDTSLAGTGSDYHLYSVLVHEIAHIFGHGTAPSWFAQVSNDEFIGPASVAEHGGNVPCDGGIGGVCICSRRGTVVPLPSVRVRG